MGVHGAGGTVNITGFAAGHNSSNATMIWPPRQGEGSTNNGIGGGVLTLQGAGSSITMGTLAFYASNTAVVGGRDLYNKGGELSVILDNTCTATGGAGIGSGHIMNFNTVYATSLVMDSTYTNGSTAYSSPVNLQVTPGTFVAHLGDVIPVVAVSGNLYGVTQSGLVTGTLGNITFNGQAQAWGSQFGVGTPVFNEDTFEYDYPMSMTAFQYNPANPSQLGVYLEVTAVPVVPEPSTLALLAGALGVAATAYRRKRQAVAG